MSKRRSRLEIYFDILEDINDGVNKPTRIMYKTNLSWLVLDGMLKQMLDQGLIIKENVGKRNVYRISDKGENVLKSYKYACDQIALASTK